jgi:hypothetical protein
MGEIVNIRDFKRKEEDTAPSEIVPFEGAGIDGMSFHIRGNEYAPTPRVFPSYQASDKDPA